MLSYAVLTTTGIRFHPKRSVTNARMRSQATSTSRKKKRENKERGRIRVRWKHPSIRTQTDEPECLRRAITSVLFRFSLRPVPRKSLHSSSGGIIPPQWTSSHPSTGRSPRTPASLCCRAYRKWCRRRSRLLLHLLGLRRAAAAGRPLCVVT